MPAMIASMLAIGLVLNGATHSTQLSRRHTVSMSEEDAPPVFDMTFCAN